MLYLRLSRKELLLNGLYQPIDVNAIAKDANLQELNKVLELLVGIAVRCENKRERTGVCSTCTHWQRHSAHHDNIAQGDAATADGCDQRGAPLILSVSVLRKVVDVQADATSCHV